MSSYQTLGTSSWLRKRDRSHVFVTLQGGGHDLSLEQNRIRFLETLGAFLREHLAAADDDDPAS